MTNYSIEVIDRQIKVLQEFRKELVKAQQREKRRALNAKMSQLLIIVRDNPGITASDISKKTNLSHTDYNNTMTSLVRRNLIINKGSRRSPSWYCI